MKYQIIQKNQKQQTMIQFYNKIKQKAKIKQKTSFQNRNLNRNKQNISRLFIFHSQLKLINQNHLPKYKQKYQRPIKFKSHLISTQQSYMKNLFHKDQIFLILILLFLFNKQVQSITGLTSNNCPDGFDITTANISNPNQALVKFFYTIYDDSAHKQKVQQIVIEGDQNQLNSYMNQMMIPYIGFAAAYFIFFMIIVCCNVFEKTCPPCQSWRRDFNRRPYQKFQMRCAMVFTIVFATAVFVVTIVMFTSFPLLKKQMELAKCSLFNTLDITKNGDQTKNWGGFAQLKNQVGNISSLLTTASNEVNSNFKGFDGTSNDDWIIDDMFALKKANLDIYKNNNDSGVVTPNPQTTRDFVTTQYVSSRFITTGMGPNGTANRMVTDIDSWLRKLQVLSNQAYLIEKQALIMVDSAALITANTNSSQQTLTMYQKQLGDVQTQLRKIDSTYFSMFFDWGMYAIQGLVGFILAASVFILLGTISVHILDILACRTMVHIGWIIYAITYFGIIGLTYAFLSGGSIAFSFCNYYDGMLTNKTQFNRIGQAYSQNSMTKLDVCLYGDGNVLQKFNIAKQMQTVTQVFTSIQTYYDYQNPSSVNYINKALTVNNVQGWIDAMQKYKIGIYNDSDPLLNTDDNPLVSLKNFNTKTKYFYPNGTRHPKCPRDIWVFDKTNCSDPAAQIYQTSTEANGMRITSLNDICISFNQKLYNDSYSIWNFKDVKQRYQQIINDCPAYDDILYYAVALLNYRDSRQNLFQGIKDQLTALKTLLTQFNSNLALYKNRVDTFYAAVSTLNNLVTDKISGLLVSSDCRVVKNHMMFTNNVFCKNSMSQISTLGICSILLLFMMIGGIITSSVFAMRYARIQTLQKHTRRIVIPQGSIVSQTFQKRQKSQSSSSSSSSDQD